MKTVKFAPYSKNIKNFFDDNGYVVIKKFFSPKQCDQFLKKITPLANKEYAPIMNPDREDFLITQVLDKVNSLTTLGEKTDFLNSLKGYNKFFRKIMLEKKTLNILKFLKGKKVCALMSQMIFKKANTKYAKQSWQPHQDNSYPKNKGGHYTTINIFMNKSSKQNGTLYVWEKSHKHGLFKFKSKVSYREKDNKPGNTCQTNKKFKVNYLEFSKGDMLVMHGNLVHGSQSNKSNQSRPLYSISYIPVNEIFIPGRNAKRMRILN